MAFLLEKFIRRDEYTYMIYVRARQTHDLQINAGRGEIVYKLFSFHGAHIWNYITRKIPVDVSYACFKNLTKPTYKLMIYCIE